MRSLAREESEESPEESDLKKLASVTVHAVLNVKEMKRRNTHDSTWDILGHRPDACAKVGPLIARA